VSAHDEATGRPKRHRRSNRVGSTIALLRSSDDAISFAAIRQSEVETDA